MDVLQRLRAVDWTDPGVRKRANRAGPLCAGLFAATGSLVGTVAGFGGAVGAGLGGGLGAILGYIYAGLRGSSTKGKSGETE